MLLKFKKDFSFEHLYSGKLHFGDELSDKQTFWLVGTSCQGGTICLGTTCLGTSFPDTFTRCRLATGSVQVVS